MKRNVDPNITLITSQKLRSMAKEFDLLKP